jgi:hypothetical protein
MSRASPILVLGLVAFFISAFTFLCVDVAWASGGSSTGDPGQFLGEENASDDQGDPDELDSTDGRTKVSFKDQTRGGLGGGQAPGISSGHDADLGWPEAGEFAVLIQMLSIVF